MKKIFCNFCDELMTDKISFSRMFVSKKKEGSIGALVEKQLCTYIEDDDVDVCKYCVIDEINRCDDRPKCND